MVYLINPLYIIANVIFVDLDRKYIFIERHCWNTTVHLLFKNRKPTKQELHDLKDVIYDAYCYYQSNQKVDSISFNRRITEIQLDQLDFHALNLDNPLTTSVQQDKKFFFNDETEYHFDQYLTNKPIDMSDEDKQFLLKVAQSMDDYEEECKLFINYLRSYSIQLDALVTYIGFGRCISLLRTLNSTRELRYLNEYEFYFIREAFNYGIGKKIIELHSYDDCLSCSTSCERHIRYFYLCEECCTVNTHKTKDRRLKLEEKQCTKIIWFDEQGKIDHPELETGEQSFNLYDRKFFPYSQFNVRSHIYNVETLKQKEKQLEEITPTKKLEEVSFLKTGFLKSDEEVTQQRLALEFDRKSDFFNSKLEDPEDPTVKITLQEELIRQVELKKAGKILIDDKIYDEQNLDFYLDQSYCINCKQCIREIFFKMRCKCNVFQTSFLEDRKILYLE